LGEQARAWLERTGDTYFQIQNLVALAQYALARDDSSLAEQRLREALPLALAESSWFAADIYRFLTETLLRQGRVEDAAELVDFARRGIPAEQPYAQAAVKLAQAALAAANGNLTQTVEQYEDALALLEQLELRMDLSQARIAYGRALRALDDSEGAREQFDRAREACMKMGAIGLVAEVERELTLVGSRAD
jgi:tetratricopeptide (TPR) repeat protein